MTRERKKEAKVVELGEKRRKRKDKYQKKEQEYKYQDREQEYKQD